MKKFISVLILAIVLCSSAVIADAGTVGSNPGPAFAAGSPKQLSQILFPRRNRRRGGWGQGDRVRYETVTVRKGHKLYRDTYRITFKNGREKRKRVEHRRIA